ncbi:unnamed protein product [Callosobruchus maculatus]|nr:unnamed protein product [Callosobruchus maculatus]
MEKWATYDLEQIVTLENMKTEVPFDDDEFDYNINVRQLYPEVGIKSENDESVNFTHDVVVVNSVPLGQILKEEDDILYGNEEKGLLNCYHCNYSADHRISLIDHMKSHMNEKHAYMYSENENIIDQPNSVTTKSSTINDKPFSKSLSFVSSKQLRCEGCDVTFSTKTSLDRHTLRKHPQFISSITSKIRECKICTYKAITKYQFDEHMRKHSGEEPPNKFRSCIHCNARFASKRAMDNHVFRKHPKFIETVTNKIYECKICTYKAITKFQFVRHMRKHSGEKPPTKFISCIHCNARFASKRTVDDHVIRKHPKFVETVTSKIHQCKFCIYKTTVKSCFRKHMQKHGRTNSSYKFNNCNFPEGPLSCYHCNYSADDRTSLIDHTKVHTNGEKPPNKFISCTHCNARFASKRTVDDHVLRKHPKFIETVTSKIYECTFCIYKTTANSSFRRHLQKHGRTMFRKEISCDKISCYMRKKDYPVAIIVITLLTIKPRSSTI